MKYYVSNIIACSDYYPFGMLMPGRNGGQNYRYNFQGQETDDEVKGKGNSVNYKYRMHDPRLGRFFAVDPLSFVYPYYSPYAFAGNMVIRFVELEGLEPGKTFNTPNEAALNFSEIFGKMSIQDNREYAAVINEYIDENGVEKYFYTLPKRGKIASSKAKSVKEKYGEKVGDIHTHGAAYRNAPEKNSANNSFSKGDWKVMNVDGEVYYVATHGGFLKKIVYNNSRKDRLVLTVPDPENQVPADPNDLDNNGNPFAIDYYSDKTIEEVSALQKEFQKTNKNVLKQMRQDYKQKLSEIPTQSSSKNSVNRPKYKATTSGSNRSSSGGGKSKNPRFL